MKMKPLKRVPYARKTRKLADLTPGYHGKTIDFDFRPYEQRSKDHQRRFDGLVVSIFHDGIKHPLITFGDHVLIGQQRHQIGLQLGIEEVEVLEIQEDISEWGAEDIKRLELLREEVMWGNGGRS